MIRIMRITSKVIVEVFRSNPDRVTRCVNPALTILQGCVLFAPKERFGARIASVEGFARQSTGRA